jgi:hypothetical protein
VKTLFLKDKLYEDEKSNDVLQGSVLDRATSENFLSPISLTVASLTNKKLSNPLCHINSASLEVVLLMAYLSITLASVLRFRVFISFVDEVLSIDLQLRHQFFLWEGKKLRMDLG